jgi:PHD/YefM family antitoxin component YafN of YafNO toxin-antitoxin module
MKTATARPKVKRTGLGKLPVVILPLAQYERMKEDLEMLQSKNLERKIRKSRQEVKKGKVVSLQEVLTKLEIS